VIVKCGRCRSQFDAPGEGRYACPACGAPNEVRRQMSESGMITPSQPPPPVDPSPRVECEACGFRFIVGDVESAPCPMCGAVVAIPAGDGGEES